MECQTDKVAIRLNGAVCEVPQGLSVAGLLDHLGVDPSRVAVEIGRRIVRKSDWSSAAVDDGAEVEVVHFVGGGRV